MEELSHVCFRDVAWLQVYPLTAASVLDYFSMSQFYERTCNNEVLKMQARFTENTALLSQLHTMTGVEYAIIKSASKLFVIAKQYRHSPEKVTILSVFYVLDGSIFMSPDLNTLVGNRLATSMYHFNEAIKYANKYVSFDVAAGQYRIAQNKTSEEIDPEEYNRLERLVNSTIDSL